MNVRTPLRLVVVACALAACRRQAPSPTVTVPNPVVAPPPTAAQRWAATWAQVESLVSEGRYGGADSVLVAYLRSVPPGDGARAQLWRVLLRLEPRTTGGDPGPAIAMLDSLLADSTLRTGRAEGLVMRRGLAAGDSLRRVEVRRRTAATQQASDRADELRIVRDSLQKLASEIDRLKKRLRSP
ncbi:MAG: hypothetical protein MUF21_06180 [Gemmatimonadaceae bacterium]|jgi:hypothetical protein|nr:hypothetical protein [Gemmatimonadaceae bacterium]